MRKLMWFAIGTALACGLCAYMAITKWMLLAVILSAVLCMAAAIAGRVHCVLRKASVIFLGLSVGLCWFWIFSDIQKNRFSEIIGEEVYLNITATDYGTDINYGTRADGIVKADDHTYRIRIYLKEEQEICPGDVISGGFDVRSTTAHNDNGSSYFSGQGIFLTAYQSGEILVSESDKLPILCYPAVLRNRLQSILEACFPEDTLAFAKALLLGEDEALSYEVDTHLKISGIRHIVAVSGLHLSVLYGLICVLTLRRRFLTAALGIPTLILFAAVAGFTPSVTRACIMICLMMLASLLNREYDAPSALAFSALLMLVQNPYAITSVSLQLSVSCVAGILLFQPAIHKWMEAHLPKRKGYCKKFQTTVCSSISVTLSAMSLVTPLSAWYFGMVSLVSIFTNLLTLWAVGFTFYGLIAVCLLYWMIPVAATALAWGLSWLVRYILFVAEAMAFVPLAAICMDSIYVIAWLVFVYILLAAFLFSRKKRPGVLVCCILLGLCFALLLSWAEPLLYDTQITLLDVGQGQSILLQSEGKTWLVDCGGDDDADTADIIAERLLSQGIRRIDGIILTHYDRDHAGALHNLLTRIDTKLLILPDTQNDFVLPDFNGQILWIWDDMEIASGTSKLTVYGPVYSGLDNENSLCILFDTENCDILITGDRSSFGERMLMRNADLPDVDVLVAGHHGAADAASEELLRTVKPEITLISVAENNYYGHPSADLLQRLDQFGCAVYRTDRNGTITIRR